MKKIFIIEIIVLAIIAAIAIPLGNEVHADCGGAHTAIIDCGEDDGSGRTGVCHILNLVVETLSIGIGILGVLGITIMGVQYLTAGGNEEKVKKAKRRMVEIVIGVAMYVLAGALIQWMIPGHNFCGEVKEGNSGPVEDGGNGGGNW